MTDSRSAVKEQGPLDGRLVLGRYRVIRPLAKGGMGVVYLGRLEGAAGFSKPVVIKQVLSHLEAADAKVQFAREARILSELQHPGIVAVLDFGEESDSYVMVLEYVHGYHVGQWLRYTTLTDSHVSWEFAIYVALRVLEAIHYAHTRTDAEGKPRAIIHRDISPGNVLIDVHGNVRLVDFGIARASEESETKDGIVKGKLSYIAPEIYGSRQASVSSDVYGLGVVLYQLITGKNPFSGTHMSDTIARVLNQIPPLASSIRKDVPSELDDALARALAKDPGARFPSAQAFASALRRILPRDESDVAEEFRALIAHQFNGDLPELIGTARLSDLDSAWRESSSDPESERPLVTSGLPPGSLSDITATQVDIPGDEDSTRVGIAVEKELRRALALDRALSRSDSSPPLPPGASLHAGKVVANHEFKETQSRRSSSNKKLALFTIVGAGAIAAIAAGLVIKFGQSPTENQEPRYLLVERQSNTAASNAPGSPTSPSTPPSPTGTEPTSKPTTAPDTAQDASVTVNRPAQQGSSTTSSKSNPVSSLTQAFAKRQSAVQGCFVSHAGTLKGSPQVSIRFEVATSGAVNQATVSPAAVAGTSLGQCLKGVAQATRFPAQENAVAFSIPIVARVVGN